MAGSGFPHRILRKPVPDQSRQPFFVPRTEKPVPIVENAPAKVNLSLHVLRRRPDGYHELDSLVAFVPQVADRITLQPMAAGNGTCTLTLSGPFAHAVPQGEENLALRAASRMRRHWPDMFPPVRITLEKNLPAASGIGGGSADAAAVMRAMCRLAGKHPAPQQLRKLALELGADVPVCLLGRPARMRGIGEALEPLAWPAPLPVLLCNPGVSVATAEVFRRLSAWRRAEGIGTAGGPDLRPRDFSGVNALLAALAAQRNDLERPARELAPEIGHCLEVLRGLPHVRLARMSGSGATCFALFDDMTAARAALRHLRRQFPRWWLAVGRLQ